MARNRRIMLLPDCHIPDQHKVALANVFAFIKDYQPDELLMLGDLYDFKSVARWSKDTIDECGKRLQHEVDEGDRVLHQLREAYAGPLGCLIGNHEARWNNYLQRYAPGLWGMLDLTIEHVGHFGKYDVDIKPQPYPIAPGVDAIHGLKLAQQAGASAMKHVKSHGKSIVQGHTHRLACLWDTTDKHRFALECGHLSDQRKASYLPLGVSNWSMGFGLLTVQGQDVYPEAIKVSDQGRFIVQGQKYGY